MPHILYAGDSDSSFVMKSYGEGCGADGVLFSVACGYSKISTGTGLGLFYTLGGLVATLGYGSSLCTLVYSAFVGMVPATVVVSAVFVKTSAS